MAQGADSGSAGAMQGPARRDEPRRPRDSAELKFSAAAPPPGAPLSIVAAAVTAPASPALGLKVKVSPRPAGLAAGSRPHHDIVSVTVAYGLEFGRLF